MLCDFSSPVQTIIHMKEQTNGGKQSEANTTGTVSAQPRFHQPAREIQSYGSVSHLLPLELEEPVLLEMTEQLNQLLADTMTLRDLYKKSHWQLAGPTFYQLHASLRQTSCSTTGTGGRDCRACSITWRRQYRHGS